LHNRAPREGGGGGRTPFRESGTVERGGFEKHNGSSCGKGLWQAVLRPAKNLVNARDALSPLGARRPLPKILCPACQQPFPNQRPVMHACKC